MATVQKVGSVLKAAGLQRAMTAQNRPNGRYIRAGYVVRKIGRCAIVECAHGADAYALAETVTRALQAAGLRAVNRHNGIVVVR